MAFSVSLPPPLDTLPASQLALLAPLLVFPAYLLLRALFSTPAAAAPSSLANASASIASSSTSNTAKERGAENANENENENDEKKTGTETKSIMQPPKDNLAPPRDDPFTQAQLSAFDGSDPAKPVYLAIKGRIFDVSPKRDMYGPGASYNVFAGKDGSRGLGKSSLKPADAVPDYTTLTPDERKVLDDWFDFFSKRYNIVGRVVDLPEPVANL